MMDDEYIQHHIEIETPHLRATAMTRYEQCWAELMHQMYKQAETIHGGGWPVFVLERMERIENEVCGPLDWDEEEE